MFVGTEAYTTDTHVLTCRERVPTWLLSSIESVPSPSSCTR
jgi:hypothetical protein